MNRENKRKKYKKHYYKNHACTDSFTCKVCGGWLSRKEQGQDIEIIVPTV